MIFRDSTQKFLFSKNPNKAELNDMDNSTVSWVRLRGPVIQANGRLTFEDDLRSGGLLCFISMNASVCTELADSMVTPGEPGGD